MFKRVFVLGAGFSYHLSGKIFPLGCELANVIKEINIPALNKHIQGCSYETDNIEMILSRLELDNYVSRDDKENIREEVSKAFQKRMLVKSLYEKNEQIIESSKLVVKDLFKRDDLIVTLNYDLLLEHLLAKSDVDIWSPCGNGYGASMESDWFYKNDGSISCNQQKQNIQLLKVHGSFNFFTSKYAGTEEYSDLMQPLINDTHPAFFDLQNMFENLSGFTPISPAKDWKNTKNIILPTYVKPFSQNRSFMKLWHDAIDAMKEAEIVTIIGYRFPNEDSMMSLLFSFLPVVKRTIRINILNRSADEISKIRNHIEHILKGNSNNIEWTSFPLSNNQSAYKNLIDFLNNCTEKE